MKLIKQSKLFFKEGNSDKVYEIDLCEVGAGLFVVNFRFGRRAAVLKEGTKTDKPISITAAEQVFDALEAEKRRKGYQSEQEMFQPLPEIPMPSMADNENLTDNAILKRLKGFTEGTNPYKSTWKASRVIWKAGEIRLKEATPFIIRLTDRGDEMQRYAALWALGRMGDASAERTLRVYFSNQKYTEKTRRIAGEGLIQVLEGKARQEQLNFYAERLPENIKNAWQNAEELKAILQEMVFEKPQNDYDFLENLYVLSVDNVALKKEVITILKQIPLKAGFFKPIRHILKIAELRDDFETLGLLSYRFERTLEMFKKPRNYGGDSEEESREYNSYIPAIGQSLKVKAELKKKNSRIAYSDRTRAYLIRKSLRQLKEFGEAGQADYVRLALAILISYDSKTDYKAAYSNTEYKYSNDYRSWQQIQKNYPVYADAVLMNLILYGNATRLRFTGKVWVNAQEEILNSRNNISTPENPAPQNGGILNRVFDSVFSLFAKPKQTTPNNSSVQATETAEILATQSEREELYPALWDKTPQAYIQLLLKAQVDEIHEFALKNLLQHANYEAIKAKIDFSLIEQFLASSYMIPARFGFELVKERLADNPDKKIVLTLLNSPLAEARQLGLSFIEKDLNAYFEESAFVENLLFSEYENVRIWAKTVLSKHQIKDVQQQLLVGRSIARLLSISENSETQNTIIKDATQVLLKNCGDALANINNQILTDLLNCPVEATQVFAVKIIILKNAQPSAQVLCSLLVSPFEQVRKAGGELLTELKPQIEKDQDYATALVNFLVPFLMRKEPYEGLHQDVSDILCKQLSTHLHTIDSTSTTRLIHSNYRPAQDLGLVLLNQYVDARQLALRDIINLGSHELLVYRAWCSQYFNKNIARIKYEREEAIRLLDAKWDDSRAFACDFFRTHFTQDDWSPEVLIAIADSVRPDIEAFGRELISRFFEEGQGEEYLLKLSQHPSTGVQLFATNYLERFASNDNEKLRNLHFYFRSVLTRVNKGRSAKGRIFSFLHHEALQSNEAALTVADILREVSATAAIEDKATCINIMQDLKSHFQDLELPIKVVEFETR